MIECSVWWARPITETQRFHRLLSPAETDRFAALRQETDRRRFLTGRVLARTVLAEHLELPAERIEFDASCADCDRQHGPPRLPGSGVAFSISHSGDRVGLAVTDGVPVGLDVEETGRQVDGGVLAYALNETELAALRGLTDDERGSEFFTYWTRKEALLKATGRGLRLALTGITLSGPGESPRLVAAADPALDPERARLADLDVGAGYRAAVAVLGAGDLRVREYWRDCSAAEGGGFEAHGAAEGGELG